MGCKLIALTICLAGTVAFAAISTASREILDLASNVDTEGESAKVVKELQAKPRAKVVQAVREGLEAGGPFTAAASRAASVLGLKEVVPDLEKSFAKTQDWEVALSIGGLANDAQKKVLAEQWLAKADSFDSPTRVAVFQTLSHWGVPLSSAQFNKALVDKHPGVRTEAVRSFFKTRAKLKVIDQTDRYKKAFSSSPYSVRLEAMLDYESIPMADRTKLASAVDSSFKTACQKERNSEVKTECQRILKGAR